MRFPGLFSRSALPSGAEGFLQLHQHQSEEEILRRINNTVSELHLQPLMNRSLFDLSGGQKQKIACASVAVTGNKIILLDEPSANLDLRTIDELAGLLRKWKGEGKTIVIAEHRISYLWDLADRTIILNDGQIVRELSRSQMDKITEDELHELGLRTNRKGDFDKFNQQKSLNYQDFLILQNFRYKYKNGYQALNIPRDVRQVPKAVSRSVIKSFLYVVIADVIISIFYLVDYMNNLNQLI